MQFQDAKQLAKRYPGSTIVRTSKGDHAVITKDGKLLTETSLRCEKKQSNIPKGSITRVSRGKCTPKRRSIRFRNKEWISIEEADHWRLYGPKILVKNEWTNYLLEVRGPNNQYYEIGWNGVRFALSQKLAKLHRCAPDAAEWMLSTLREIDQKANRQNDEPPAENHLPDQESSRATKTSPTKRTRFELLLFDLDETLVHSEDLERFRGFKNVNRNDRPYQDELLSQLATQKNREIYSQEFLRRIRTTYRRLKFGVLTRAPRKYTELVLTSVYPRFKWDVIVSFEDVLRPKPAKDGVWSAMAQLDVKDHEKVVLIGDEKVDVETAYYSGCWIVLDQTGWTESRKQDHQRALEKVPDVIISDPEEVVGVLENPDSYLPALERWTAMREAPSRLEDFRIDRVEHSFPGRDKRHVPILVLGRRFSASPTLTVRRQWHPVSAAVGELKDARYFPNAWIETLCFFLERLPAAIGQEPVVATVVPAKPEREPRLEYLLKQLESRYLERNGVNGQLVRFSTQLMAFRAGVKSHYSTGLGKKERFENIRDHLYVVDRSAVRGRHIVVIDDVVTTGATLLYSDLILRDAGASNVSCLSLTKAISSNG